MKINSLEIEECYFEQKPDRHRPFVLKMREGLRLCEFTQIVCVSASCARMPNTVCVMCCIHFRACAWVPFHVYVSILVCMCVDQTWPFLRRRKQLTVLTLSWV